MGNRVLSGHNVSLHSYSLTFIQWDFLQKTLFVKYTNICKDP